MKILHTLWLATLAGQITTAQTVPSLINYQGRLTDPSGVALPKANYGIEFRLWDSPSDTNGLVWGQRQNVGVQANGVFNVILGAPGSTPITNPIPSVNDLGFAFAAGDRFLGLTVVSSNGVAIAGAVEIVPRQRFLSVPFAIKASAADSATNATFASNAAIAASATNAAIAASVLPGSITTASLTAGLIQTTNLADGAVSLTKLAPRAIGTNVGVGGVALSATSTNFSTTADSFVDVPNLVATLITTGKPVFVGLIPDGSTNSAQRTNLGADGSGAVEGEFAFLRNSLIIGLVKVRGYEALYFPPGALHVVDFPAAGTNVYRLQTRDSVGGKTIYVQYVKLIAYEL